MSSDRKLWLKLENQTIKAADFRTLLKRLGFVLRGSSGSHESWTRGSDRFTFATHNKELKKYTMKEALKLLDSDRIDNLLTETEEDEK